MKTFNTFFNQKARLIILIALGVLFMSFKPTPRTPYSQTDIKEGVAVFSGKIAGGNIDLTNASLRLEFADPLIGYRSYAILVDQNGNFSQTIPCSQMTIAFLHSDFLNSYICLLPNEETKLNIILKDSVENNEVYASVSNTPISYKDMDDIGGIADRIIHIEGGLAPITKEMSTEELRSQIGIQISRMQDSINVETQTSEFSKKAAFNHLKLYFLEIYLENNSTFKTQAHYSFLQDFNIDNLDYLSFDDYYRVLLRLFDNSVLNIPAIGDLPIVQWQDSVKNTIGDILGVNDSLFYDILAINAYTRQLDRFEILSSIQKENIKNHFTNSVFTNKLLNRDEELIAILQNDRIHDITTLPQTNSMDTIINPYKGKVVVADFWATWCRPCIANIRKTECVKEKSENSNVAFLYLADETSPRSQWVERLPSIKGEHYYLTSEASGTVWSEYGIWGVPHYLIYDKEGVLQYSGDSMDPDTLNSWIEKLNN